MRQHLINYGWILICTKNREVIKIEIISWFWIKTLLTCFIIDKILI